MAQEKKDQLESDYLAWLRNLTPEEEAAILAKYKAEIDAVALEAECRELLRQREGGELIPMEQVLRDLGIDVEEEKEPA